MIDWADLIFNIEGRYHQQTDEQLLFLFGFFLI